MRACVQVMLWNEPPLPHREVLEWPYTAGGGGYPPPLDLPPQSDHRGKKRNLLLGKSGRAIFGAQTFGRGSGTPPPFPPSNTSLLPSPPHSPCAEGQLSYSNRPTTRLHKVCGQTTLRIPSPKPELVRFPRKCRTALLLSLWHPPPPKGCMRTADNHRRSPAPPWTP